MPHIPKDYENVFDHLDHGQINKTVILVSTLSYLTLIGWIAAMVINGKHNSTLVSFHLRQSIGLIITGAFLTLIPLVGWALNLGIIIAWVMGLYSATQGQEYKVPLVGKFYQKHLIFIK
ncbi:hypothetical protein [Colwellia sp. E2M01]|uniref:DUF4870 domain-containing protein n=1 Tax=Colwellia sp. E2M01 TaxID=2841561 RepID=UPI001C0A544A|nr:hypothetical protein [Colwellia sp. E2M01]MBU2870510.1 hypothetical protein [Colwellia sp. E2M01]